MVSVPFDDPTCQGKYEIDVDVESIETGDGVILSVNKEGLLALSELFSELAKNFEEGTHFHLGYTEEVPQGPGWRIVLSSSGRARET